VVRHADLDTRFEPESAHPFRIGGRQRAPVNCGDPGVMARFQAFERHARASDKAGA
jgi:hypothetical protein